MYTIRVCDAHIFDYTSYSNKPVISKTKQFKEKRLRPSILRKFGNICTISLRNPEANHIKLICNIFTKLKLITFEGGEPKVFISIFSSEKFLHSSCKVKFLKKSRLLQKLELEPRDFIPVYTKFVLDKKIFEVLAKVLTFFNLLQRIGFVKSCFRFKLETPTERVLIKRFLSNWNKTKSLLTLNKIFSRFSPFAKDKEYEAVKKLELGRHTYLTKIVPFTNLG